jgi:peptidoglycan/xylan/chitin deacetylase (PgdA/CDA1 family)
MHDPQQALRHARHRDRRVALGRYWLSAALLAALLAASGSSAAGTRPVAILAYHHVAAPPHGAANPSLWVRPALFRRQVGALARAGYRAVTLERVWRSWHGGPSLPARPVVLSFDDGYASQYRSAAAALRAHGWPGVLNLQLGRLGKPGGLSSAQVRSMIARGWEIDAHSVTHPDLTKVDPRRLAAEVAGSRRAIRDAFGVDASFFAYPYGRHDAMVRHAVLAAGFLGATTVHRGLASPRQDRFALDRITVPGRMSPRALLAALG